MVIEPRRDKLLLRAPAYLSTAAENNIARVSEPVQHKH